MDELLSYSPVYDEDTDRLLNQQFSRLRDECYVDHAGATLYADDQIKKFSDDLLSSLYTNPHSHGTSGNLTEDLIDNVRYRILDHFHTSPDEYSVVFTSGSTASLKLVAETFDFDNGQSGADREPGTFAYLQDNHTSVLGMRDVASQRGAKVACLDHRGAFERLSERNGYGTPGKRGAPRSSNSLFVYAAQCNFSGLKYPRSWIDAVKRGQLNGFAKTESNWYVLLDAACYAGTSDLDLSALRPDFVCLSFYKLFGYPTGVGALLVRNESARLLRKIYYGGGTVDLVLSSRMYHVKRESLSQRFEDGTVPFLSIVSLQYGFRMLSSIGMCKISEHVFSLARHLHHQLLTLHHGNGAPVAELYADTDYEDGSLQGGIVSFNLLRSNGEYVGYMEFSSMAALHKIHPRTGCFCNPGACQRHLRLSDEETLKNHETGYTCGGTTDLINGRPTGAVRISFGYMSTLGDVRRVVDMIRKCFVSGKEVVRVPSWWDDRKFQLDLKYKSAHAKRSFVRNIDDALISDRMLIKVNSQKSALKGSGNLKNGRNLRLAKIFIYPVKSCGEYQVRDSWQLTYKGLQYDREWMIVTSAGVTLTQKQETKLCLIKPVIDLITGDLILNYPDMPSIKVPLTVSLRENKSNVCKGKVCGHKVEGIDCGPEVSEWLSLALGRPNLKLIRQSESIDPKRTNKPDLSFASQGQYLLVNSSSISWLAERIPEDSECNRSTLMHRFRSNFVVEGCAPFEETKWKTVEIGNSLFEVQGVCNRCQMICIDQETGEKTVEPLRTLAEEFSGKLKFGIYLLNKYHDNILKIGEDIYYS